MKKIKSKVYRAIKKKKRMKEQANQLEKVADADPEALQEQQERQERDRAKERLSLRHRNKTKFTEELRRYAGQKEAQNLFTELNRERRKILKKLDLRDLEELASGSDSEDLPDDDGELIEDLQKELDSLDNSGDEQEDGIVAELMRRGKSNLMAEAQELIESLQGKSTEKEVEREKFQRQDKLMDEKVSKKFLKGKSALEALREANAAAEEEGPVEAAEQDTELTGKRNPLSSRQDPKLTPQPSKKTQKQLLSTKDIDLKEGLLEGVQITKLKEKYQKRAGFNTGDMRAFMDENDQEEYNMIGEIVNKADENRGEFEKEKLEDYEKDLPVEQKALKGWGDWTGAGVIEKPIDPQIELEKKRRQIVIASHPDGAQAEAEGREERQRDHQRECQQGDPAVPGRRSAPPLHVEGAVRIHRESACRQGVDWHPPPRPHDQAYCQDSGWRSHRPNPETQREKTVINFQ